MRLLLSALIMAVTFSLPVSAQEWPTDDFKEPSDIPEILKPLQEDGAQIRYIGTEGGFNGWVIFNKGQPTFTYTSDNERVFFQGMMYGPQGENITLRQLKEFRMRGAGSSFDTLNEVSRLLLEKEEQEERVRAAQQIADRIESKNRNTRTTQPAPEQPVPTQQNQAASNPDDAIVAQAQSLFSDPTVPSPNQGASKEPESKGEKLLSDFERSNWVALGERSAPEIYAMIDPDCEHCRKAMRGFRQYLDQGQLEIRMVPIAFEDRAKRVGALLLAAGDAKAAYYNYIDGNLPNLGKDASVNTQGVERNIMTAVAWGFNVTPMFFYRAADGEIKIIKGVPKDYRLIMEDIYG